MQTTIFTREVCISCKDGKGCRHYDSIRCIHGQDIPIEVVTEIVKSPPQSEYSKMVYGFIYVINLKASDEKAPLRTETQLKL